MQLNSATGSPRIIQTKRGTDPDFRVARTSGITLIRFQGSPLVDQRQLETYGPILAITNAPAPQSSECPSRSLATVFEFIPVCLSPRTCTLRAGSDRLTV